MVAEMVTTIQKMTMAKKMVVEMVTTILKMTMAKKVVAEMVMSKDHCDDDDGQDDSGGADGISPSGTRV